MNLLGWYKYFVLPFVIFRVRWKFKKNFELGNMFYYMYVEKWFIVTIDTL